MSVNSSAATIATPIAAIHGLIRDAMRACNLSAADADRVAELMAEADLTGADGHGIFRLPQYVRRIRGDAVNTTPDIRAEIRGPSVAVVDGDNGMGHLVMSKAAETAISLARETGIGWVGVRGSNHAGPGALYAEMPVKAGMIGIYSAVASANHMAVWGGTEALLGTNPLAVGIPAGNGPPVLLDIATTVVSYGTVKGRVLQDKPLPEGWMVSKEDGAPLTDQTRTADGVLLPIGGYKGSGLALVLGILAGTLNGAAFGKEVIDFNADSTSATNTGHFILALDIARFMPPDVFAAVLSEQLASLRSGQTIAGMRIRMPGEQRTARRAERSSTGVPLAAPLLTQLDALATELGIATLSARV
ncbi:Ldh family oxidoreductase [Shinella sp.]|uniref:Ldh family oxidoreductase n=1 Tax=Shinella sp. TaxID=1870904 RepID=UPI003F6F9A42